MLLLRDMQDATLLMILIATRRRLRARQNQQRPRPSSLSRPDELQSCQTPADTVSITSGEEDGEDDQLSEVKSKTQLPLIEDSLVWDGHTYQLMKGDKTRSLWLCKSGPGHCSGKVVLDKGEVVVTGEHCHQPQLGIYVQDYIPSWDKLQHLGEETSSSNRTDSTQPAAGGFSDRTMLSFQSSKAHVGKTFKCQQCGARFALSSVLDAHRLLEHKVQAQWQCMECGVQFLDARTYSRHVIDSHTRQPFPCNFPGCSAMFGSMQVLMQHRREDHQHVPGERPRHKCPHCTAEYTQACRLKMHLRQHTGEKPYPCKYCSMTFAQSTHRASHMKHAHMTRTRNHLCNLCGKKFYCIGSLKSHMRTHTGEKPFSCPVCSRQFSRKTNLNIHLRQHTGAKPHVCDKCGQAFTVAVSLRTHLKSKHNIIVEPVRKKQNGESEDGAPRIGRPPKREAEHQLLAQVSLASEDVGFSLTGSAVEGCLSSVYY